MAKDESRGNKERLPAKDSEPTEEPSGPLGDGGTRVWRDQFGRLCIGNECFHAAVDQERKEIRVVIDESGPCGGASQDAIQSVVSSLKEAVGEGAETVYQTKSKRVS